MGSNHGMSMDPMGQNAMDDLLSTLFGFSGQGFSGQGFSGQGFSGQGFSPGFLGGQNVRVFHNGRPVNMAHPQQKPAPIIMSISVPIDKILSGTTVPIDVERWIVEHGNKVHEHETIYVTVPKGIDEGVAEGIAEGIAEGLTRITTFIMNPVAKSEWVLCAITISPVLVALPVAMNALHRPRGSRTTVPSFPSFPERVPNESWFFS